VAALAAAVLALGACSSGSGSSSGSNTTIRFVSQDSLTDTWNKVLIPAFESANPGIKVVAQYSPTATLTQTLLTQLQGGNGPDVFYTNGGSGQSTSVLQLAKAGRLADLSTLSFTKNLPAAVTPLFQQDGKTFGLPLAEVPVGVIYNQDVFNSKKVSVPTTFTDLLNLCGTLKSGGVAPFELAGSAYANTGILGQIIAASNVYSETPTWNQDRANKSTTFAGTTAWNNTLQHIEAMKKAGCFEDGASGAAVPTIFAAVGHGSGAMLSGPGAAITSVQKVAPSVKLAMFPFPGDTADATRVTMAYSDGLAVNNASKKKDAALKFVDFMSQPTQAAAYAKAAGALTLADAATGKVPATIDAYASYLKDGRVVALPNLTWPSGDIYQTFGQGITGLLTGQSQPNSVLTQMDANWDKTTS
jgi:raffinose/stachyose/melibiose transport system substrate-binding protein